MTIKQEEKEFEIGRFYQNIKERERDRDRKRGEGRGGGSHIKK